VPICNTAGGLCLGLSEATLDISSIADGASGRGNLLGCVGEVDVFTMKFSVSVLASYGGLGAGWELGV
jgi:hypothetical protein